MSALSYIDWSIVTLYLFLSLGVGFYMRTKAGENIESYFVAGRKMSGWLVGTSMVATTFAADTPLAVTGIVAKNGIAGNWFWWSLCLQSHPSGIRFLPASGAERISLPTPNLSSSDIPPSSDSPQVMRAFFFAVPINCIIMGWVIRAMGKIVSVLFPWDVWLGPEILRTTYAGVAELDCGPKSLGSHFNYSGRDHRDDLRRIGRLAIGHFNRRRSICARNGRFSAARLFCD